MKQIRIFAFLAALCIPWYAAAQSYGQGGETFRQEGIASWYGAEFDGRPTASGEIYNSTQYTAAHPNLPFGTILIVTNKQNNRQVTVRVNDRGPFVASRIVDLSRAAAEYLDMITTGVASVVIETLPSNYYSAQPQQQAQPQYTSPAPAYTPPPDFAPMPTYTLPPDFAPVYIQPPIATFGAPPVHEPPSYTPPPITVIVNTPQQSPQTTTYPLPALSGPALPQTFSGVRFTPAINPLPGKMYRLQVGSYKVPRNAVDAFSKLKAVDLNPAYEQHSEFYRVVLAKIPGTEIQSVADKLARAGFHEVVVYEEK